jgi:biopolymer transport protein ExbD
MNQILEMCLKSVLMVALTLAGNLGLPVAAQSGTATQGTLSLKSGFAGTWKGTMNGLPAIDLAIREDENRIGGDIVFYFQERADANSPWRVAAEHAVPLLSTNVTGKILTFEVEHHVCHGCKELGPNVAFRMELAGINEARLTRLGDDGAEGAQVKLIRGNGASGQSAPPLQAGISVEMPITKSAVPMPDADREDALIVTVTSDGRTYLGINPRDLSVLATELQTAVRSGKAKTLYLKADGRAPYATVAKVVDAATAAGIETTVLLTSQPIPSIPEGLFPPQGFTIVPRGCWPRSAK